METRADRDHWADVADEWIAWARTPGHDVFWAYRERLADYIGSGSGEALDVGCGEGRVSRVLKGLGYHVTAADVTPALLRAAEQEDSAHAYVVAEAARLPFPDATFDLVVAYNMLMDVDDVPAVLRELRRVMRPDGELMVSIVHPFVETGAFAGPEPDAPFVVQNDYFGRRPFAAEAERNGLRMRFAGWTQPLEAYVAALEAAGLAITSLREPVPDVAAHDGVAQWTRMPLFLWLKARPLPR